MEKIAFTKHAAEKFALVKRFGFIVSEEEVLNTIRMPDKVNERSGQIFSMKVISKEYALRVVHERRKGIIVVITFYPVRRERYGL